MAARSVRVIFENRAHVNLALQEAHLDGGIWTDQPPQLIGNAAEWASESSGVATGTEGHATYSIQDIDGNTIGSLALHWDNPFIGSNSYDASASPEGQGDGSGFSAGYFGGGGNDATVTFLLLGGKCSVDSNSGEVACTQEQAQQGQPQPPFVGRFGTTPPDFQPAWLYVIQHDGVMLWYRKDATNASWQGPKQVGVGWQGFKDVIPAGGNRLYAIAQDGTLKWYQHQGFNDGSFDWNGPVDVGSGWTFLRVFGGSDGIIYAIQADGTLLWYQNTGFENGTPDWNGPKTVGSGWAGFKDVFSTGNGHIYAVQQDGILLLYNHLGYATGEASWGGPYSIGTGWQNFRQIVPVADGVMLAIAQDGKLLWYKNHVLENATRWEGPVEIGSGWQNFIKVIGILPSAPEGPH